jgi:hypothetical protein
MPIVVTNNKIVPVTPRDKLFALILRASWQQRKDPYVNSLLMQAAQNRANDMAKYDYFGHTSPTGKTVHEFIRETGYKLPSWYKIQGNFCESIGIGYATPEKLIAGWWESPRHKAHMTGSDEFYRGQRAVGTGLSVAKDKRLLWVFLSAPAE